MHIEVVTGDRTQLLNLALHFILTGLTDCHQPLDGHALGALAVSTLGQGTGRPRRRGTCGQRHTVEILIQRSKRPILEACFARSVIDSQGPHVWAATDDNL
jgi:hypothetical protein